MEPKYNHSNIAFLDNKPETNKVQNYLNTKKKQNINLKTIWIT
jgi:hypothetical protein